MSRLTIEALSLEQTPLDRFIGELELREAAARGAVERAKTVPPEPDSLAQLRGRVEAVEATVWALRNRLFQSRAALDVHDQRRPNPVLGRLTGALNSFEARRAELVRSINTLEVAEAKRSAEMAGAQRALATAAGRWKGDCHKLIADRWRQADEAEGRLAVYARARRLLSASSQIALCGFDSVIALAVEAGDDPEASWNGLALQDIWGIGQLGPSHLV